MNKLLIALSTGFILLSCTNDEVLEYSSQYSETPIDHHEIRTPEDAITIAENAISMIESSQPKSRTKRRHIDTTSPIKVITSSVSSKQSRSGEQAIDTLL